MLAGSGWLTVSGAMRLVADPTLAPMRAAAADEVRAATDRSMARIATPDHVAALIRGRLDHAPRNWVALDALQDVAAGRDLALPPDLAADLARARSEDASWGARAADCAACTWDIAQCSLSNVLICKAPILLTPVEDVRGLVRAGADWAMGADVDEVDLALSVAGLGATLLVVATGGSSVTVKAGSALARAARGMRLLSPGLERFAVDTLRAGIDMPTLARARNADDAALALRADALASLTRLVEDTGRLRRAVGDAGALHLIRLADNGTEARAIADAAGALGPRVVGQAEVLGKARLLRATLRVSDLAWQILAGLAGLLAAIAQILGGGLAAILRRLLRRAARG